MERDLSFLSAEYLNLIFADMKLLIVIFYLITNCALSQIRIVYKIILAPKL